MVLMQAPMTILFFLPKNSEPQTWENDIEEVVEGLPPDDDVEPDIWVRFWTTAVLDLVTLDVDSYQLPLSVVHIVGQVYFV